jgi:hypothetical protein
MFSAAGPRSTFHQLARQAIIAACVALVLMVAAGAATNHAAARFNRISPGGDSFQRGCKALQDAVYERLGEYRNDSTTNARRGEILNELRTLGGDWRAIGCQAVFGDIVGLITVEPARPGNDQEAVAGGGQEAVGGETDRYLFLSALMLSARC